MPELRNLPEPPPELREHPLVRGRQVRFAQVAMTVRAETAEDPDGDGDNDVLEPDILEPPAEGGEQPEGRQSAGTITGHAAVYSTWSLPLFDPWMGLFRERIQPGFFDGVLGDANDCRFLGINHNPDVPLARVSNRSLELTSDGEGLGFTVDVAATQPGRDTIVLVQNRDVTEMSFGFDVAMDAAAERWDFNEADEIWERTLIVCGRLYDISPVVWPAYPGTNVNMRSLPAPMREAIAASAPSREPAPAEEPSEPDWRSEIAARRREMDRLGLAA